MSKIQSLILIAATAWLLQACSSTTVKSANYDPVQQASTEIAEAELLDVGIQLFDGGFDIASDDEDELFFPELRNAETHYMPYRLMETLQKSAAWGAVRVVPGADNAVDVLVQGTIVQSDGEILILDIKVVDAANNVWFETEYEELASKYSYDRRQYPKVDPFQGIYNRIANDMFEHKAKISARQIVDIRTIAEIRFAQSFAPEAFDDYVQEDRKGKLQVERLPAQNDPMLNRIRRIRERDYLFVDTLQEYYGAFVREMDGPYTEWRDQSYEDVIELRKLQRSAINRTVAGVAAIAAGIAAAGSDNGSTATAGQVGVAAGGLLVKSGFDKRAQSKMHVAALQELGDSLETAIESRVIELEDRTVTLTGTVQDQYSQWREILQDIYQAETAGTPASADDIDVIK